MYNIKCNHLKQLALFLDYETVCFSCSLTDFVLQILNRQSIVHIYRSYYCQLVRSLSHRKTLTFSFLTFFLDKSWKSHWPNNQDCHWTTSVILAMFTFFNQQCSLNWACQTGSNSALGRNPTTVGWLVGGWGFTGWDDYEDHFRNVKSTWCPGAASQNRCSLPRVKPIPRVG